jgi:hypothetical protein
MYFTTEFIQDNARITDRSTTAFLDQCALNGSGLPLTRNLDQYILVRPAGRECSVNE